MDVRLYLDDAYRSGQAATYRYVRFDFSVRKAKDAFELCEVGIWGEPDKRRKLGSQGDAV